MIGDGMERVARASMLGHQGDRAAARALLDATWEGAAEGPALLRCAVAHALADVQDDPDAELAWDERALTEAAVVAGEPVPDRMPPVAALLPSLHLDLADVHRRRGDPSAARTHVAAGRTALDALGPDAAQAHIAEAFDRVEAALGSPPGVDDDR